MSARPPDPIRPESTGAAPEPPAGAGAGERTLVVLPDSGGEILEVLSGLDEVLAAIAAWAGDEDLALPAALPAQQADRAVATLTGLTRVWEQAVRDLEASRMVLAAPDGFDLVALHLVEADAGDLAAVCSSIAALADSLAHRHIEGASLEAAELVDEALHARSDDPAALIEKAVRLGALLALPTDDDVEMLRGRLGTSSPTTTAPVDPTRLSPAEYRAYLAVTERILATWHAGDRLARFLYRGNRP